jgi:hypothetical protein
MSEQPSITIMFDPETRIPKAVLINGRTDLQTAKLREIADRMVGAIMEGDDVHTE